MPSALELETLVLHALESGQFRPMKIMTHKGRLLFVSIEVLAAFGKRKIRIEVEVFENVFGTISVVLHQRSGKSATHLLSSLEHTGVYPECAASFRALRKELLGGVLDDWCKPSALSQEILMRLKLFVIQVSPDFFRECLVAKDKGRMPRRLAYRELFDNKK